MSRALDTTHDIRHDACPVAPNWTALCRLCEEPHISTCLWLLRARRAVRLAAAEELLKERGRVHLVLRLAQPRR
jgi:hypothetical protein